MSPKKERHKGMFSKFPYFVGLSVSLTNIKHEKPTKNYRSEANTIVLIF